MQCCSPKRGGGGGGGGKGSGGGGILLGNHASNLHQLSFLPSSPYLGATLLVLGFPSLVKTEREQSAFCNTQLQCDAPYYRGHLTRLFINYPPIRV